jgi:hypothetical protein
MVMVLTVSEVFFWGGGVGKRVVKLVVLLRMKPILELIVPPELRTWSVREQEIFAYFMLVNAGFC